MENNTIIELEECPSCRGVGSIVHEGGWNVQVECCDCGAHTVYVEYSNDAEKQDAERSVARLWNMGKVIKLDPGE
ncbi:MAG: Lar family restriction alleviation protein [Lentisphaeria bacterium]|nr:Lar family restriction alleviation protein [Lentisphaeria bacterium]